MNHELPDVKAGFRKSRGTRIKLPTSVGSQKKPENYRKASTSDLLTIAKPLTVWITTNWKIPQETGILNKLTCLLRNLYAGQEATVKTGHGKRDWFQIGRIQQGCRVPEKTSISALLTIPKPLTVWITINCGKFFKRWEYQTT